MSTVFYGYRVERSRFWDVVDEIRDFYYRESPLMQIAREIKDQVDATPESERTEKMLAAMDLFLDGNKATEKLTVELQVFEEDDRHYIVQPLEWGYTFMNHFEGEGWAVEPVSYDNRTDVPPEMAGLLPLVDRICAMTVRRRYFLTPVISLEDAWMYLSEIDQSPAGRDESAKERFESRHPEDGS